MLSIDKILHILQFKFLILFFACWKSLMYTIHLHCLCFRASVVELFLSLVFFVGLLFLCIPMFLLCFAHD